MLHNSLGRRPFLKLSASAAAALILAACQSKTPAGAPGETSIPQSTLAKEPENMSSSSFFVYIGTYTENLGFVDGKADGIYVYKMDASSGALTFVSKIKTGPNPSFLAFHPNGRFLYSVNENQEGSISAYARNPQTGGLTFLNEQSSHGSAPCFLTVDRTGSAVLTANYSSGTLAMLPILSDGKLAPASQVIQHEGSGKDPERQEGPHAHSINMDPANRFAIAADLGLDELLVYKLDLANGKLPANDPPFTKVEGGAGPRHLAFHPNGRFVYVINELNATMDAFTYDAAKGVLKEIQSISTVPAGYKDWNGCADVHVTPSGAFVYGSNRGHNSIVSYSVDESTGKLTYLGNTSTQGKTPRNFAIDPNGNFLLAANQDSSTIVTFRIDARTGQLQPTGQVTEVPTPVCLKFIA